MLMSFASNAVVKLVIDLFWILSSRTIFSIETKVGSDSGWEFRRFKMASAALLVVSARLFIAGCRTDSRGVASVGVWGVAAA